MSVKVMTWVWDHSRSKKTERLVLLAIADCASDDGSNAYPSMAEIRRKTGLSERAAQSAIKNLVSFGELFVGRNAGPRGCNRYRVIMVTPADPAPPQNQHPPQETTPAESAPPQTVRSTPADPAPGTVLEPSEKNSSTKSSSAPKRGTRIPEDFTITDEMRGYAQRFATEALGRKPDDRFGAWLDRKTLDFTDYWNERSGQQAVKRDWKRAWQRWMRREIEQWAEQPTAVARRGPGDQAPVATSDRKIAQVDAALASLKARMQPGGGTP